MLQISNGNKVIAVVVVLLLLGYSAVTLRFTARKLKKQAWGVDDWLVTVALIPLTGLAVILVFGCAHGSIAKHIQTDGQGDLIITEQVITGAKIAYAYQLIEVPTLGLLKLSVLLCYRRIFNIPTFRKVNNGIVILVLVWVVACIILNMLDCGTHIGANYSWSVSQTNQYCTVASKLLLAYVITDVVLDTTILIQTVPVVVRLEMPVGQKIITTATFPLGSVAVGAAMLRMVLYIQIVIAAINGSNAFNDELQIFTFTCTFTYVEIALSTVAACLPALRAIATKLLSVLNVLLPKKEVPADQGRAKRTIVTIGSQEKNFNFSSLSSATHLNHESTKNDSWTTSHARTESGPEPIELQTLHV